MQNSALKNYKYALFAKELFINKKNELKINELISLGKGVFLHITDIDKEKLSASILEQDHFGYYKVYKENKYLILKATHVTEVEYHLLEDKWLIGSFTQHNVIAYFERRLNDFSFKINEIIQKYSN